MRDRNQGQHLLQFFQGLSGNLQVIFEEGTWAAWLYDLLKPHVTELVVCNPRKNALLKEGSKSDRIDARKLAELLRHGSLSAVYHGEHGLRMLKELSRSYLTISKDLGRVMNRLKALYQPSTTRPRAQQMCEKIWTLPSFNLAPILKPSFFFSQFVSPEQKRWCCGGLT